MVQNRISFKWDGDLFHFRRQDWEGKTADDIVRRCDLNPIDVRDIFNVLYTCFHFTYREYEADY